jgi:hypothetical protein
MGGQAMWTKQHDATEHARNDDGGRNRPHGGPRTQVLQERGGRLLRRLFCTGPVVGDQKVCGPFPLSTPLTESGDRRI